MAKEKAPNYTPEQEARIEASVPLNADVAAMLAAEFGKSPRSVIAKAVRMGVAYERKTPTTKTGEPITKKETLVAEISAVVSGNLEGLEKAPKPALVALRNFVVAA